jgi:hypothetical protein
VSGLTDAVAVAAGELHSLAVKSDGSGRAWGRAAGGALGNGNSDSYTIFPEPVPVTGLAQAVGITAGKQHSIAFVTSGLSLKLKTSLTGCLSTTGTVTLGRPAPLGGATVLLASSSTSVVVPPTVTVAMGRTSAKFLVQTQAVPVNEITMVTASYQGIVQVATLTLTPVGLGSLTLSPTSVVGGGSVTATVKLVCAAGTDPVVVGLGSSNLAVAVPGGYSVTVPTGLQTATFTVHTEPVKTITKPTIFTNLLGVAKSKVLTVTP